jgi:hypothetical protein
MPACPRIQRYNDLGAADQASLCDPSLTFTHARLNDLAALYAKVRGARTMPTRADFPARMLAPHLRNLTFVDRVIEPGRSRRYRFRYFGSGMAQHSEDRTGKYLDEVVAEPFLTNWNESWDMPLELGMPLRFVSRFRSLNLEYIAVESLTAPLCDADGNPCGLLVSSETAPAVAKAG